MLLLVPAAFAHPGALPHLHAIDPLAVGVFVFWMSLASVWLGVAARGGRVDL